MASLGKILPGQTWGEATTHEGDKTVSTVSQASRVPQVFTLVLQRHPKQPCCRTPTSTSRVDPFPGRECLWTCRSSPRKSHPGRGTTFPCLLPPRKRRDQSPS